MFIILSLFFQACEINDNAHDGRVAADSGAKFTPYQLPINADWLYYYSTSSGLFLAIFLLYNNCHS